MTAGPLSISVGTLKAELTALCAYDAQQPSIGAMDGACFEQVRIGRHRLAVVIDRQFFRTYDTHAKLCALAEAPAAKGRPRALLSAPRVRGVEPSPAGEAGANAVGETAMNAVGEAAINDEASPLLTTIVKRLRWVGRPYPGATIDHHVLAIPGVGRIYFGEMVVSGATRRLTMMRFALDGAVGLDAACCEVEAGGSWHR